MVLLLFASNWVVAVREIFALPLIAELWIEVDILVFPLPDMSPDNVIVWLLDM
jgi:hypothetical protein